MEALNEALLEPANNGARDDDGAAPVRLEWAGVGVVAALRHAVAFERLDFCVCIPAASS